MSLFQAKEWWGTKIQNEEFDQGCMVISNIDGDPSNKRIFL